MSLHSAGGIRSTSSAGLGAEVSSCAKPGAKGSNEQLTNIQGPEFGTAASQLPSSPKGEPACRAQLREGSCRMWIWADPKPGNPGRMVWGEANDICHLEVSLLRKRHLGMPPFLGLLAGKSKEHSNLWSLLFDALNMPPGLRASLSTRTSAARRSRSLDCHCEGTQTHECVMGGWCCIFLWDNFGIPPRGINHILWAKHLSRIYKDSWYCLQ